MHEVELHHCVPSSAIHDHGIGRLRALALNLQASPAPNQVGHPTKPLEQISLRASLDTRPAFYVLYRSWRFGAV